MNDIVVTVTNPGAANVSLSNGSVVNATVGNGGVVNVAIGTISPGNATVVAGTLTINSTTTLAAGNAAYARNIGTAYAALLDIGIPAGPPTNIIVGNTTTLSSGNAAVTGVANGSNLTLSFAIPRGASGINGTTPSFAVGNVTTLAAGGTATVTATPSNGGANVVLNFAIPRGVDGTGGGGGSSNLTVSDATPSNLGVASAGTSTLASRSDHTHNLPVIAYANLSGVPSNFPSNIASVSGLQSALDAKQTAGNYLTTAVQSVNNLTGNLSLIAAGGLSIAANGSTLTLTASADVGNSTIDGGDYVGQLLYGITFGTQPQSVTANVTTSVNISSGYAGLYSANIADGYFSDISASAISGSLMLQSVWVWWNDLPGGRRYGYKFRGLASADNGSSWTSLFTDTYPYGTDLMTTLPAMPITTASNGTRTVMAGYKVAYSDSPASNGSWGTVQSLYSTDFNQGVGYNKNHSTVAHNGQRFGLVNRSVWNDYEPKTLLSIATSSDGANWTSRTLAQPANVNVNTYPVTECWNPIISVNGTFIVAGLAPILTNGVTTWRRYIWTSSDGVSWTASQFDSSSKQAADNTGRVLEYDVFLDMASSGTLAIGINGTTARYTTDGTTWGTSTLPVSCNRIAYAAGRFWAFNGTTAGTDVCYSTNGQSWTLGTMPNSALWQGVAGNSPAIAYGDGTAYVGTSATMTIGTTYASANLTVSATATGGGSIAYQWQKSLDAGTTWSDIANATTTTLSLSNLTQANNGTRYRAVASSTGAALGYSQSATLTVTG